MEKLDFTNGYLVHTESMKKQFEGDVDKAMQYAVGANFEVMGAIELELLIQHGLTSSSYLIDVGCGSGRLAKPASEYMSEGRYLGTDVVPDLVEYARKIVNRPAWRFEVAHDLTIPETDGQADMVCFFSVFTHMLHEHTYMLLKEAKRVLKPTGKIVFSFLEFGVEQHWHIFENRITNMGKLNHPDIFISRDGIEAWAKHLELKIDYIEYGDKIKVNLPKIVVADNGHGIQNNAALGQSVCCVSLA